MENRENFQPVIIKKNVIKGILYILFLIILSIYFIFFERTLKLEHSEKCPCENSYYTLYQYRDRGKLLDDNKYDFTEYKAFKLKNRLGFTIDKLVHIDMIKMNDTISENTKQKGIKSFAKQFYWDCNANEVWVSDKYKLSFK